MKEENLANPNPQTYMGCWGEVRVLLVVCSLLHVTVKVLKEGTPGEVE